MHSSHVHKACMAYSLQRGNLEPACPISVNEVFNCRTDPMYKQKDITNKDIIII